LPMLCQLCDRDLKKLTAHHLVPRQTVKRRQAESAPTIDICAPCHRQIHVLYSNLELARDLNTVDKLKSEPKMRKFLGWIRKQDPHKKVRVRR
ncbi:MAG: hypothetical protein AAFR62_22160, partial [Cyanobacteria bacterium J06629_2]